MSWQEMQRSLSKKLFCQSLQKLVPEIQVDDLETGDAGVRAQAVSPEENLILYFQLVRGDRALHLLNAPNPGAIPWRLKKSSKKLTKI